MSLDRCRLDDVTGSRTSEPNNFHWRNANYCSLFLRYLAQFSMVKGDFPRVLDVGCGEYAQAAALYAHNSMQNVGRPQIFYTGVDASPFKATEPESAAVMGYELISANICEPWDWAKPTYDVVWYTEVIEHIPQELALHTLKEARRVGTKLLISTPCRLGEELVWPTSHDDEFTREEVRDLLAQAGWVIVKEWGVYRNWTRQRSRPPEYAKLKAAMGPQMAAAVCQVLYPEISEGLAWLCC